MTNKEELLKNLLKNLLDARLKRLEKRNIEQMKDLKLEKESYNKQGILLKKISIVKIEPKKKIKRNTDLFSSRIRDKTPTNFRTKTKSLLNDNDKDNRSKTPNITLRKRKHEPKVKPKEKTDNLRKAKTPLKSLKKPQTSNNSKITSHVLVTSNNLNKNKKINTKPNTMTRKAITPDIRIKNKFKAPKKKPITKKTNNNNNDKKNNNNNLKLIDIKTEDLKEFVPISEKKTVIKEEKKEIKEIKVKEEVKKEIKEEVKKEIKEDVKKEIKEDVKKEIKEDVKKEIKEDVKKEKKENVKEKILSKFEPLMGNNKIINTLSSFLDDNSQYNFFSCNKRLIKYLYEKLMTSLDTLKIKNNITFSSTIQDQINAVKLKYQNDQLKAEPPKFALSKGTVKAIELLNDANYNNIFKNKELLPPLNEIILVYRIFFQLLNANNLYQIKNDKLFWNEAGEFILNNNNGKTGEFFKESIDSFDFSIKNIYKIKKIVSGNEDRIKPTVFSKICQTTGLVIFLIKDSLEYIGILTNPKKNIPSLLLKYLEYIGDIQNKIENYINNLKKLNNNM